jgi:hypothetical protein
MIRVVSLVYTFKIKYMKLYLLTQNVVKGLDTHDSCVVCAETADIAKNIHPYGQTLLEQNDNHTWPTNIKDIDCEEIGVAKPGIKRGVIIASFNAG